MRKSIIKRWAMIGGIGGMIANFVVYSVQSHMTFLFAFTHSLPALLWGALIAAFAAFVVTPPDPVS